METKYKEYYSDRLRDGNEFQDFICFEFWKRGIVLLNIGSKKYQYSIGETVFGAEIKNDKKCQVTGNVYIETNEKSNPSNELYVDSGIFRDDNSWLYIIGNYNVIWIFAKKHLVFLNNSKKYKEVKTATSIGFLLPIEVADRYCCNKIEFDNIKTKSLIN